MCKSCGCATSGIKIQYRCDCKDKDYICDSVIGFEKEPASVPHCCSSPIKCIK